MAKHLAPSCVRGRVASLCRGHLCPLFAGCTNKPYSTIVILLNDGGSSAAHIAWLNLQEPFVDIPEEKIAEALGCDRLLLSVAPPYSHFCHFVGLYFVFWWIYRTLLNTENHPILIHCNKVSQLATSPWLYRHRVSVILALTFATESALECHYGIFIVSAVRVRCRPGRESIGQVISVHLSTSIYVAHSLKALEVLILADSRRHRFYVSTLLNIRVAVP